MTAHITFISTMDGYGWGGSEELWSRAALKLSSQGVALSASVHGFEPIHSRVIDLKKHGIDVVPRRTFYPRWRRVAHKIARRPESIFLADVQRFLEERAPALTVISNGMALPPIEFAELCIGLRLPFVTIAQANHDGWWPYQDAARYHTALSAALRCYFVSEANRELMEKHIGGPLPNAEIVRNPFNVPYDAASVWPPDDGGRLLMACVARLEPSAKGQDILFEALAGPPWDTRDWNLALYGDGPQRYQLERLSDRLGLASRVQFCGHVSDIPGIWKSHHLAVMPSRYEGMPLALVEAALCGRPALVTDVAGNGEVVEDGVTGFLAESPTVPALRRALEKAWERRGQLSEMGEAAAKHIRELVPPDPAAIFAQKLKSLIPGSAHHAVSLNQRMAKLKEPLNSP